MVEKYEHVNEVKIFIWQPSMDHLQYFTWLALRALIRSPITFVLGSLENHIRKTQDWKPVDLNKLDPIVIPPDKLLRKGINLLRNNSEAIHVFQAFRGGQGYNYFPLILFALRKGIKVVVIDEAYTTSPVGYFHDENIFLSRFKTCVRPLLRRFIGISVNVFSRSNKPCLLPLSIIAKDQFVKAGFDPNSLFPFGYFVPRQQTYGKYNDTSETLRLIFVGAIIYRKGLDILGEAVRVLYEQGYKISLDIYGSGDLEKQNFSSLPIRYKGILPYDEIQAVIAEHDILILPSRHDGWGVVVNEALLQGVPVIVSSRVGAKQLAEATNSGLVFESANVNDLVEKIRMVVDDPTLLNEMRRRASQVGQLILPENGARYFWDVLMFYFFTIGSTPSAIWCRETYQG